MSWSVLYLLRFLQKQIITQPSNVNHMHNNSNTFYMSPSFIKYDRKLFITTSLLFIFCFQFLNCLKIPPGLSWISRLSIETAPHRILCGSAYSSPSGNNHKSLMRTTKIPVIPDFPNFFRSAEGLVSSLAEGKLNQYRFDPLPELTNNKQFIC